MAADTRVKEARGHEGSHGEGNTGGRWRVTETPLPCPPPPGSPPPQSGLVPPFLLSAAHSSALFALDTTVRSPSLTL